MELPKSLVDSFVKTTNDESEKKNGNTLLYGTVVEQDGSLQVQMDGTGLVAPAVFNVEAREDDRVNIKIENHTLQVVGNITAPPSSRTATDLNPVIDQLNLDVDTIHGDFASFKDGEFENLKADVANFKKVTTDDLEATNAEIKNLKANTITADEIDAKIANLGYLKADEADIKYATIDKLNATNATIKNLEAETIKVKDLEAETGKFGYLKADEAQLTYATIDNLTALNAEITNLKAKDAEIENAVIGKADIGQLNAAVGRVDTLESNYAEIKTLVNGNLTSDNIQSLTINAENTTIENGTIKNAMIESLTFDKITGIDINTNKLTIHSNDGNSKWSDNTIQISDPNRVRVQIGKDASGDYSLSVWDKSGKLIWDALGATEDTIQRKIIRDNVVADDANISGSKLDITSVIKEVNDSSTKLKTSTISFDETNQTLDVVLKEMETTVDGINETTKTNTTSINTMQGQITSLISEDENIKGDYNALVSKYNSTVETVDSIKTTIGEHTSKLEDQDGKISSVESRTNEIEVNLNGMKETVSATEET